jgi:streptogramin lyase/two-component sensor histidine kinase
MKRKAKVKSKKANFCRAFVYSLTSLLFFFLTVNSQEIPIAQNFHQWGSVTLFNGLPSDNVHAIAQTLDGILWFGTENGLARFDGRRVQTVPFENVAANKILALKTDDDGTLWIGTEAGTFRLQDGRVQPISETKEYSITSILLGENVFLATGNGEILKLVKTENSYQAEKVLVEKLVGSDGKPVRFTSLIKSGGKIIAGSQSRSLLVIDENENREIPARPYFVNALTQDTDGNIWLGADIHENRGGLFQLNDSLHSINIGEIPSNVLAIISNDKGGVWIGTQSDGLYWFRGEQELEHLTFADTAGGLRSNTINTLLVDREGVLWIGTNRGVCRYDAASPFNQIFSDDSNVNFVRTIFHSNDGHIFAGTNRGLFLADNNSWLETGHFSQKAIYTVGEDTNKQLLIGTPNGLFGFDGKQISAGDIRATANFQGKTYLAVFGRGLMEGENLVFANDSLVTLLSDGDKLWLGTAKNGVFFFDGKEVKQDQTLEKLRGAAVWKISKGVNKDLWFATERGLFLFQNGELQNVIEGRGVRDVAIFGADIWTASSSGISHARHDDLFGWVVTNLNVEQGLPSQQIFALLGIENRLLIGTNRGVVNYVPSQIPPKVVATRVLSQRLHEPAEIAGTIAIEYPQTSLLVEVAGLSSRTFPEQFQYAFLLKNSNGEILDKKLSNDSQFAPIDLKPGQYSIEIRAFNKDLLASEPLIIRFSVARAPFPWTATALGILLTIALAGLIWAMIERRRMVQKNRELAVAKFDLANEAERERKRIARDLHDQTLADLRSLMLMSDKLPSDNSEFRMEIELVSTEIRRICEDLSPSVLENVGLPAALEFLLQHTIGNYKFSAPEDLDERLSFSPNVQMQIYRIAQEVLTNIKHHSDAKSVEMKVDLSEQNEFMVSIKDNGTPFNPTNIVSKGRGINNIRSRSSLIEAEVNWVQNESCGTEFLLTKK